MSTRDTTLGTLEPAGDRWRLRFSRHLPHSAEKVWRALTEPEHTAAWFPTTFEGELEPGAPLTFRHAGRVDLPPMTGELIVVEPPSVLEFTWGEDLLRFELTPDGDGTRLTLTDIFDEHGRAARDGAGWHTCLARLAHELGGEPAEQWSDVHPLYVGKFGPEAATIGPPQPV
jgi:uncharacterized protein YndB with AHSA1/START domain